MGTFKPTREEQAMLLRTRTVTLAAVLAISLCPGIAPAQFGGWEAVALAQATSGQTITGTGTATLERAPGAVRVHVEIFGRGKTLEEALVSLKDRREAARMQLESLGADRGSVNFGPPSLSNPETEQKRRFEAMVMQRMRATGRKTPKGLQVPKSFTVSSRLSADWPLAAESPEKLLLATHSLTEKIKAADLARAKKAKALSPEEEELAEEMAEMMSSRGEEQIEPGTPVFSYVARITDQDRDKAMAEAFQKAKANAERLARAARTGLGPLVGVSGGGGGASRFQQPGFGYDYELYEYQQYIERLTGHERSTDMEDGLCATTTSPDASLKFTFHVTALFRMETP
ncbi:MAG: SIMPL domain-containing protein [Planctomycetota bacterium]